MARPVVLIVEDEPLLRLFAVEMVEDAGFDPVEAADATEAVRVLESRDDVRLLFADVDMPRGVDGIALAQCVSRRWPPIAMILTSGKAFPAHASLPDGCLFFAKPYCQDQVAGAMQRFAA